MGGSEVVERYSGGNQRLIQNYNTLKLNLKKYLLEQQEGGD